MTLPRAVAVILGSAYHDSPPADLALEPVEVATPRGPWTLHRVAGLERPAYVSFRHGLPHRWLPHQVDYRAQALALRAVGCGALLVTSSVGVLDPGVPLARVLLGGDLLWPENRLPDGSPCSVFEAPSADQGHLLVDEGLFSPRLNERLRVLATALGVPVAEEPVVFAYAGGPRTKTPAENRFWARAGAQVNSMTVAPELVLAAELGIPAAALLVGHKYSHPDVDAPDDAGLAASLEESRRASEALVRGFLREATPLPPANPLFRFGERR